jgi:type IV pilus assembly protein PilA
MRAPENRKGPEQLGVSSKGFSLIELVIVVAIILIVAAIAIPNFLRAKMQAHESAAAQNLRTITTAEVIYSTTYNIGFSNSLTQLSGTSVIADPNNAGLIDSVLASTIKGGYVYTYTVLTTDGQGNVISYSCNADPQTAGVSGQRHFYTDQSAIIRSNEATTAGPSDSPIQ